MVLLMGAMYPCSVILVALVSVIIRLGPSVGYGGLNHHDVYNSGVLYMGHLVKLNIEARHAGGRGQLPEVFFRSTWKAQYSLPISIVRSDGVADVNHVPVISTIDGICENLSLGSAASCASLNHLDCNGGPSSLAKES